MRLLSNPESRNATRRDLTPWGGEAEEARVSRMTCAFVAWETRRMVVMQ